MSLSFYDLSVPLFCKYLANLKVLLEKGFTAASEAGMNEADFLNQKLAPDMFPLLKQVQIATDNAKGAAARLTGTEPMKLEDAETTVSELLERIDMVITHLKTFKASDFAEAAQQKVILPYMPDQYQTGKDYLLDFAIPNFMFHLTIAYAIIRAQGVKIGKQDYMGSLNLHPISS